MKFKERLPNRLKLEYQLLKRLIKHTFFSKYRFATEKNNERVLSNKIVLKQDVKRSYLYENKLHNLKIAAARVSSVIIRPGEVFSFWRIVRAPTPNNNYKIGRNIIAGEMKEDYGGGLCQLSGLLHHISLIAGLEIIERHNHSIDFYTDETRYAPLGTDATVVYGYKDLMIRNNRQQSLMFDFEFKGGDQVIAYILSEEDWTEIEIITEVLMVNDEKVVTLMKESGELISESKYKR